MGNIPAGVVGITGEAGVYVPGAKRNLASMGEGVVSVNSVLTCENEIATPGAGVGILAVY
jgi:hypothetical protein